MRFINSAIANILPIIPKPVVSRFAQKYIAGETLEDAARVIADLNEQGFMCTINILGEKITDIEETDKYLNNYKEVLYSIAKKKLDVNISIKMTQLGMGIDDSVCFENMDEMIRLSDELDNFIRIDMEDSKFTTKTLDIHSKFSKIYSNVGTVIQAYLRRSERDVKELIKLKANIRLCKGIYIEPAEIVFKERDEIRQNFSRLLEMLLISGCYVGIATHDEQLVDSAYRLIDKLGLSNEEYEFQMIYGVTEKLRNKILNDGHRIRIYVPFGEDWYAYSVRRLKENPAIVGHIMKNIFSFK